MIIDHRSQSQPFREEKVKLQIQITSAFDLLQRYRFQLKA